MAKRAKSTTARRPRAKKQADAPKTEPQIGGVVPKRIITKGAFTQLVKEIKGAEADKNEAVGTIGGLISAAVEKHNINKKALGWYRAAERMSGPKLRDVLDQFEHYCEIGGLNARAEQQGEMYSSEERGTVPSTFAEKLDETRDATTGNGQGVTSTMRPRRQPEPLTEEQVQAAADRAQERSEQQQQQEPLH